MVGLNFMVPRNRIESPIRGFSVRSEAIPQVPVIAINIYFKRENQDFPSGLEPALPVPSLVEGNLSKCGQKPVLKLVEGWPDLATSWTPVKYKNQVFFLLKNPKLEDLLIP